MIKKILIALALVTSIGLGTFGTLHFKKLNEEQLAINSTLQMQNSKIQSELNAIGAMTTVYQVGAKVFASKEVNTGDLVPVSIPASAVSPNTITDLSQVKGNAYKIDINPGTILTKDMFMEKEDSMLVKKFTREITLTALPLGLQNGEYIDIRLLLPNGEEYIVFSHLQVDLISGSSISFRVSEEESYILNSMLQDAAVYGAATLFYATRYLEPGIHTDTVAFYPVQSEMEDWIRWNPNIDDPTRCINEPLRDHIDEVLIQYTSSGNNGVAALFMSNIRASISAGGQVHQSWIESVKDEEGNINAIYGTDFINSNKVNVKEEVVGSEDSSSDASLSTQVGDAMDQLQQNIVDLEAIN